MIALKARYGKWHAGEGANIRFHQFHIFWTLCGLALRSICASTDTRQISCLSCKREIDKRKVKSNARD